MGQGKVVVNSMESGTVKGFLKQKPFRYFYVSCALGILILGIYLGTTLGIKDQQLKSILADVISPVVDFLASMALFVAARSSRIRSRHLAIAWGMIGLAMLFYSVGDIIWLILEVGLKIQPFPSAADGWYLAYYPVFLLGTFAMLSRSATAGQKVNGILDIGIVMGAAILGFWNFLISPILVSSAGQTMLVQGISVAYPVGDLVLLGCIFLAFRYSSEEQEPMPLYLLGSGLLIAIVADVIYSYQSLSGSYFSGGLLDIGWIASSLLIGVSGVYQWVTTQPESASRIASRQFLLQKRLRFLQPYMPYFWLAAAFVLLVRAGMGLVPMAMSFLSLSLWVGGIIGLVLVRQIITLIDNSRLNIRLQNSVERIQAQAIDLEKANLELMNDIAQRKRSEEALRVSEAYLSEALKIARLAYWEYDVSKDRFIFNDQFYALFGTTAQREGGYILSSEQYTRRFVHPDEAERIRAAIQRPVETVDPDRQIQVEHRIVRADGEVGYLTVQLRFERDSAGRVVKVHGVNQDVTEWKFAEAERQQSEVLFRTLFDLSPDSVVLIDPHSPGDDPWPIIDCNKAACQMSGYTREELIGRSIDILNVSPYVKSEREAYLERLRKEGILRLEILHRHKNGTEFWVDVFTTIFNLGGRELVVGIDHDITARKQREEEIKRRLAELESINKVSTALRAGQTLDEMLPLFMDTTLEVIQATQGSIWLYDPAQDELKPVVLRGYDDEGNETIPVRPVKPGGGIPGHVFASGEPYVASEFRLYPNLSKNTRELIPPGVGGAAIPIRAEENVIGTLVVNVSLPRQLKEDEVHILTIMCEIAGSAIRRAGLHQQTERQLRRLSALGEIDRTITSSFNLNLNLTMLLNQVIAQLDIDAADVLLFNPALQTLEYTAGSGFRTNAFQRARLRFGEGYAGQAAMERRVIHVSDLTELGDNPRLTRALPGEGFISYFGVPLLAKGQIQGVLEIFHRTPIEHDAEWLNFLDTLARQAAIAIDNATLFDNLQRSNVELAMAYDATIEGWSRALDLRDQETEGHTQRVTEMTVELARSFGLPEAELVQVRWGALLHDIGKMGVPDEILLKPGPLTDEEWVIMKKHPVFAFEMLSPIQYLRQALDIPHYHHEKWDGTGYPAGLKGDQIPLTARIFAVIDVWDALRSDRPYRPAWSVEKVREHILAGSGTHFDPEVVKVFLGSNLAK